MAVNIDEGEPGTFKDCHYLERYPHRILEGMLIAARAVDADTVYIYLRDEYAGCRAMLSKELDRLVAEPPCPIPPIYLRRGAGAYICGEESAMIESIEGKRGMPRLRPPYIAERGLFDRPTLEHNMETLYWGHRDHRARSKLVRLPGPSRPQGIAQLLGEWPGGKTLIVMDPRRTPLARHADYVLQFRPDTDVAMLNAIMQSVIEQGLVDTDFIARRTEGFEALKEHLADFTPEKMAPICGIEADTLREVARIYAASGAP